MRYTKINDCDTINVLGGVAVSLWTSGCPHKCPQCFNPETWNPRGGNLFDFKAELELIKKLANPYVTTLSILGGEPLAEYNRMDITFLTAVIKFMFPNKDIMLWTGYVMEEIEDMEIDISNIDYIIDGKFEHDNPTKKKLRGSNNQRLWKNDNGRWGVVDEAIS
ncbi:MAG: anaerobic ribonucleoside-triphosphate reductase activating protein [Paraclostridium sp.]